MNVLTLSFTWDFVRFFDWVFSQDDSVQLYNISLYPSAHYLWRKNGKHSVLLPFCSKKNLNKDNEGIDGSELPEWIYFNQKSLSLYGRDGRKRLIKQARRYFHFYEKIFTNNKFDLILCSGDSRLAVELLKYFARKTQTKILFFEQGPYRTTILDEKGVNANSSFCQRNELLKGDRRWLEDFFLRSEARKHKTVWSSELPVPKWIRILDLFCMYPPKLLDGFIPVDMQLGEYAWDYFCAIKKSKKISCAACPDYSGKKIVLFALQVPVDAQFILHSPLYDSFFEMLKDVIHALPKDYLLVVREHPFYKGRYGNELYKLIESTKNCILDNEARLNEIIRLAEVVIVNNSTSGLDALRQYKKVLLLGDAYFKKKSVTYSICDRGELPDVIERALLDPVDRDAIDDFLYTLLSDYLIEGHFQDYVLTKACAKRISVVTNQAWSIR